MPATVAASPPRFPSAIIAGSLLFIAAAGYLVSALADAAVYSHPAFVLACALPLAGIATLARRRLTDLRLLLVTGCGLGLLLWPMALVLFLHPDGIPRMVWGRLGCGAAAIATLLWLAHRPPAGRLLARVLGRSAAGALFLVGLGVLLLRGFPQWQGSSLATFCNDGFLLTELAAPGLLAAAIVLWADRRRRRTSHTLADNAIVVAGLLCLTVLSIATRVWSPLLALAGGLGAIGLQVLWRQRRRWLVAAILAGLLAAGTALLVIDLGRPAGTARFWRLPLWRASLATAWEDRLLGRGHYGFANLHTARNEAARVLVAAGNDAAQAPSSRNALLDLLLDGGLPGLLCAALAGLLTVRAWRRGADDTVRRWQLAGGAAMLVPLFLGSGAALTPVGLVLLAVGAGSIWAGRRPEDGTPPLRLPLGLFALPLLIMAAVAAVRQVPTLFAGQSAGRRLFSHAITDDLGHLAGPIAMQVRIAAPGERMQAAAGHLAILEQLLLIEGQRPHLLANQLSMYDILCSTSRVIPHLQRPVEIEDLLDLTIKVSGHYPASMVFPTMIGNLLQEFTSLRRRLPDAELARLERLQSTGGTTPHREYRDFDEAMAFQLELFAARQAGRIDWPGTQAAAKRLLHHYGCIPAVVANVANFVESAQADGHACDWEPVYLDLLARVRAARTP